MDIWIGIPSHPRGSALAAVCCMMQWELVEGPDLLVLYSNMCAACCAWCSGKSLRGQTCCMRRAVWCILCATHTVCVTQQAFIEGPDLLYGVCCVLRAVCCV